MQIQIRAYRTLGVGETLMYINVIHAIPSQTHEKEIMVDQILIGSLHPLCLCAIQ